MFIVVLEVAASGRRQIGEDVLGGVWEETLEERHRRRNQAEDSGKSCDQLGSLWEDPGNGAGRSLRLWEVPGGASEALAALGS